MYNMGDGALMTDMMEHRIGRVGGAHEYNT